MQKNWAMSAEMLNNLIQFLNGDNVQKIFACLKNKRAFDEKTALTHTEIYNYTGLPKSVISRILKSFTDGELVKKHLRGRTRTWYLNGLQHLDHYKLQFDAGMRKQAWLGEEKEE